MLNLADHTLSGAVDVGLSIVVSLLVTIRRGPIKLQTMGPLLNLKVDLFDGDRFRAIGNSCALKMFVDKFSRFSFFPSPQRKLETPGKRSRA
jgi:hypothetical protein